MRLVKSRIGYFVRAAESKHGCWRSSPALCSCRCAFLSPERSRTQRSRKTYRTNRRSCARRRPRSLGRSERSTRIRLLSSLTDLDRCPVRLDLWCSFDQRARTSTSRPSSLSVPPGRRGGSRVPGSRAAADADREPSPCAGSDGGRGGGCSPDPRQFPRSARATATGGPRGPRSAPFTRRAVSSRSGSIGTA